MHIDKSVILNIYDGIDIPAVIQEGISTVNLEKKVLSMLLMHEEEPVAVRGYNEQFTGEVNEIRRKDGGHTWYHSPRNSYCFTVISPDEQSLAFYDLLKKELLRQGHNTLQFHKQDVYDVSKEPKQLLGTSSYSRGNNGNAVHVYRACWYEQQQPENMRKIIEADGLDFDEFTSSYTALKGLSQQLNLAYRGVHLAANHFAKDESYAFAHALQEKNSGLLRTPKACILTDHLKDV